MQEGLARWPLRIDTRGLLAGLWSWIRRRAALCSALSSSLIAGMVYWFTLAPDLTWAHHGADGGDLAAALLTGGVPHPPGASLYLWLGDIILRMPFPNPALALNALSALSAASAAGLIAFSAASRNSMHRRRWPRRGSSYWPQRRISVQAGRSGWAWLKGRALPFTPPWRFCCP